MSVLTDLIDRKSSIVSEIKDRALQHPITTFSGEIDRLPIFVSNLIGSIGKTSVLHLKERREDIGSEEASRLLKLKTTRGGPEVLQAIQQTIMRILGVKIDAFDPTTADEVYGEESAELDVDNFLVEVNGTGVREALRVVLDTEFQDPALLLVEEPEIHLHPSLESIPPAWTAFPAKRTSPKLTA